MDVDKRGYVTPVELRKLCAELGHEITAEKAEEIVNRCDPKKEGKIGWDLFQKTMAVAIPKLVAAVVLVGLFQALDTEATGYIARADLEKIVIESGAQVEKKRLDELIAKTNPLPDGRIEFKAFSAGLVAHLRSV